MNFLKFVGLLYNYPQKFQSQQFIKTCQKILVTLPIL